MERSELSSFLVQLRKQHGYTAEFVALRLNISVVDYILIEQDPLSVQIFQLFKVVEALKPTKEEYSTFFQLVYKTNKGPAIEDNIAITSKNNAEASEENKNILDLFGSKTLNLPAAKKKEDSEC